MRSNKRNARDAPCYIIEHHEVHRAGVHALKMPRASYILQLTPRDLGGVVEISRRATEYNQYRVPARDENKSRGTIIIKFPARSSPTFARGLLIYLLLSR